MVGVVAMERPLDNVNIQEEDDHGVKNGVEEAELGVIAGATAAAHFLAKTWSLRRRGVFSSTPIYLRPLALLRHTIIHLSTSRV